MLNFKHLIVLLFSLISIHINAQSLSDKSFISVLTCGEGNELYSTFGHTAIRVYDSLFQTDIVFNYGTFDFNTPNFYVKFSQGRLPYMLSVTSFENFIAEYRYEGRVVYEQILQLSIEEKENLYNLLIENYRPQNRYYAYDFFMDNCATRVRDIINKSLIDRTFFIETHSDTNASFRNLIYPYLDSMLWWRLGIDIALGMRCDRHASNTEYMFLPYELMNQLDTITISGKHIIEKKTMLLPQTKESLPKSISPTLIAYILFVLILLASFWEYKTKKYFKAIDLVLFLVLSLLSLLILYLWFLSNHYTTKFNLNLLWANPLFVYMLLRLKKSNHIITILLLSCVGIVLLGFWFLPQTFNPAVYPICLIILVRMLNLLRFKKQKKE